MVLASTPTTDNKYLKEISRIIYPNSSDIVVPLFNTVPILAGSPNFLDSPALFISILTLIYTPEQFQQNDEFTLMAGPDVVPISKNDYYGVLNALYQLYTQHSDQPYGPTSGMTVFYDTCNHNKRYYIAGVVNGTVIIDADKLAKACGPMTYQKAVDECIVTAFVPSTWNVWHEYTQVGPYIYHIQESYMVSNGLQIIDLTDPHHPRVVKGNNITLGDPNPASRLHTLQRYHDYYPGNFAGAHFLVAENNRPYVWINGISSFDMFDQTPLFVPQTLACEAPDLTPLTAENICACGPLSLDPKNCCRRDHENTVPCVVPFACKPLNKPTNGVNGVNYTHGKVGAHGAKKKQAQKADRLATIRATQKEVFSKKEVQAALRWDMGIGKIRPSQSLLKKLVKAQQAPIRVQHDEHTPQPVTPQSSRPRIVIGYEVLHPETPKPVSQWRRTYVHDVKVLKRYDQYFLIFSAVANESIYVINATDPCNIDPLKYFSSLCIPPVQGPTATDPEPLINFPHSTDISACGNFIYLTGEAVFVPLYVIDSSDLSNMRIVYEFQLPRHGSIIHEGRREVCPHKKIDRIWYAAYDAGVFVVDIAKNPAMPQLLGWNEATVRTTPKGPVPVRCFNGFCGFWSFIPAVKDGLAAGSSIGSQPTTSAQLQGEGLGDDAATVLLQLKTADCKECETDCCKSCKEGDECINHPDAYVSNATKLNYISRLIQKTGGKYLLKMHKFKW